MTFSFFKGFENVIRIEQIYKHAVDIEFAIKDNEFFLLQARAITTPSKRRMVYWSNTNVNENYPDPMSPQTRGIHEQDHVGGGGGAFGFEASENTGIVCVHAVDFDARGLGEVAVERFVGRVMAGRIDVQDLVFGHGGSGQGQSSDQCEEWLAVHVATRDGFQRVGSIN